MAYIKTPDGFYFQKTTSGLKPIDQRTLQSLMSSGTQFNEGTTQLVNGVRTPIMGAPSAGSQVANVPAPANPMGGAPMTGTNTGESMINSGDPITKFNFAILDMLSKAQGTAGQEGLVQQQTALQRAAIARTSAPTPEELRVLSPGQQNAIRSGSTQALTPEIDAVNNAMKSRDMRLQNFENILGQVKDMGESIAKLSPSKEVIEGYRQAMKAGIQPSADVLAVIGKYLTADDWRAYTSAKAAGSGSGSNTMTDNERALMTQFTSQPIVKDYNTILAKKMSVDAILSQGVGGPGDLATVYEFMKGLDPSSVVRESEYATAAGSGNIFAGVFARFNGYLKENGGFLPKSVREAFQSIVNSKLKVQQTLYDNAVKEYRAIASRQGLNPDNVVINYGAAAPAQETSTSSTQAPAAKPLYTKGADGVWRLTN